MTAAEHPSDGPSLSAVLEKRKALCDVTTPSRNPHWIVTNGECRAAWETPESMELIYDVLIAAERRRQATIVADAHRHDIDVEGFMVWQKAASDEARLMLEEDAALAALAAHLTNEEA